MNRRDVLHVLAALAMAVWACRTPSLMDRAWADETPPAREGRTLALPSEPEARGSLTRLGAVAFDTGGTRVIAAGETAGVLAVWDAASGRVLNTIKAHSQGIEHLAVSPDDRRVVVAGPAETIVFDRGLGEAFRDVGATIKVWDLDTRELVAEIEPPERSLSVAFQAGGSSVLYMSWVGLTRWDLESNGMKTWPFPEGARRVDGEEFFSVEGSAYDLRGNHVVAVPDKPDSNFRNTLPGPVLWTLPEGRSRILDLRERLDRFFKPILLSPDGRLIAVTAFEGIDVQRVEGRHRLVAILDFATGETLNRRRMPVLHPYCDVLKFSPDGTWLASASNPDPQKEPDVVQIWHVASGREMTAARCAEGRVRAMAFLADGRLRVVSGGMPPPGGTQGGRIPMLPLVVWEVDAPELP